MMKEKLQSSSHTVLIIGGTKGIGRGITFQLAKHKNFELIVCGRNGEAGEAVVREVNELGCKTYFVEADMEKQGDVDKVVHYCKHNFSKLDGLVYVAGANLRGDIATTTEAMWNTIFDTNVKAFFFLMQGLLPLIKQGELKSIVSIGSFSSYCGKPELVAYNASKAALNVICKNLANTLKNDRIRINTISPGLVDTEHERELQEVFDNTSESFDERAMKQPFGRMIQPSDIANLVDYLLSKKAEMMTGSIIEFNQHVRI